MTDEIGGLIVGVVSAIVASIALWYNAKSFNRLTKAENLREKAEELSVFDGIYREIAHGLKEYRLLDTESSDDDAESPKTEEEKVRKKKLEVLLSEFYADVSWLCFLIRHGQIKDDTLVNAVKDQIITWGDQFIEQMPHKIFDESFPDFKILYVEYKYGEHKKSS